MMNENERDELEQEVPEFSLDDILKEFGAEEDVEIKQASAEEILEAALTEAGISLTSEEEPEEEADDTVTFVPVQPEQPAEEPDLEQTIRIGAVESQLGDTQRIGAVEVQLGDTQRIGVVEAQPGDTQRLGIADAQLGDTRAIGGEDLEILRQAGAQKEEPFSDKWEPEYEQPIGEYVPPQPIVFRPRSRLRELKRKLVAGPEKRYYELSEIGLGRLQAAIFLSLIVVLLSAGALVLYALGMVREDRMKLMVFGQILGMLLAALLGCYQMLGGIGSLFKGRFTADTMLFFTFAACCVDSVFCLQQLRVPYCAAFSLEVMMSLWAEYQRRNTEMGQMDTMRKATRLDSVVKVPDLYDGRAGLLRAEGQVEDFMDNYARPSTPEKVLSRFMIVGLLLSIALGVAGGVMHNDYQMGIRLGTAAMLVLVPATAFITLSRPAAVLERRLHRVGAVLCGWKGVKGLRGPAVIPFGDADLFPAGSVKMNGVKFFGSREPDQVVAYATAVITAEGTGLSSLFTQLLDSRNGRHYDVENFRAYNGGLGGEVNGEPVLIGTHSFLRDMGVEVPEGTRVHQALYAAIDGELSGVFAITYAKVRATSAALGALCGYRSLTPVLTCGDFMLTESFVRSKFGVNTRRIAFPPYEARKDLAEKEPDEQAQALVLMTKEGMLGMAFAITGARALRTASVFGVTIHMIAGILGLVIVAMLAVVGAEELLTAENLMLFELLWLIPGLLITEWTRNA